MSQENKPEPLLVDSREAAKLLAISTRTLWTLTQTGELPCVRILRSVRYSREDLMAYIRRTTENKTPDALDVPPEIQPAPIIEERLTRIEQLLQESTERLPGKDARA